MLCFDHLLILDVSEIIKHYISLQGLQMIQNTVKLHLHVDKQVLKLSNRGKESEQVINKQNMTILYLFVDL